MHGSEFGSEFESDLDIHGFEFEYGSQVESEFEIWI
jgi:hypothetical protein